MIEVGRFAAGTMVSGLGIGMSAWCSWKGLIIHTSPSSSLLATIFRIVASCFYWIGTFFSLDVIDIAISIFSPGIGGSLASARRLFAWHAPTFLMGIVSVLIAEGLSWAADRVQITQTHV